MCLRDFKRSTEAVGLGIHPDKTKISSNRKEKEVTIDNIRVEVLQKAAVRDTCTKNRVRGARNGKSQKQTESSMGGIPQIS